MLDEHEPMPGEKRPRGLMAHLKRIAEQGYEAMESRQTRGVVNLSVPVLGPNGAAVAALTCPYLDRRDRADAPDIDAVIALIRAAGQELSRTTGGAV
jgi:DNA-binding IclR family transcriptional regulator